MAPTVLFLTGVLVAGAGCSGDEGRGTSPDRDPAPSIVATSLVERCRTGIPAGTDVAPIELTGDGATSLSGADFAASDATGTVLVLLHQTGPWGLCGWGRFAARAAEQGIASVAIDMCGYGASTCAPGLEHDPMAQVDLALAHARDDLGARRVLLVGASMGGSNTVIAAAAGVDVDAWVDVSGVSSWDGVRLQDLAGDLAARDVPGFVVYAPSDGALEYGAARRLARSSGATFLGGGSGHGYELLANANGRLKPAGRAVIAIALRGSALRKVPR